MTPVVTKVLRPQHGAEQTLLQRVSAGSLLFHAFLASMVTPQPTHFLFSSFQLQATMCSWQSLCAMAEGTGGYGVRWSAVRAEEEVPAKKHGS